MYVLNRRRTTDFQDKQLIICCRQSWTVTDSLLLLPIQCLPVHLHNFWSWKSNVEKEGTPCIRADACNGVVLVLCIRTCLFETEILKRCDASLLGS